jgi:hypothetical protein
MGDSQAAQGNTPASDTTPARIQMMGEVLASMGVTDYDPKVYPPDDDFYGVLSALIFYRILISIRGSETFCTASMLACAYFSASYKRENSNFGMGISMTRLGHCLQVAHVLLEFLHKYCSEICQDATSFQEHANKPDIDVEDIRCAKTPSKNTYFFPIFITTTG